jgi:hypothetical protein
MPDDLLCFHDEWDCQLVSAFKHFLKGEQPLARFLPQKVYSKTVATANGECEMDSIVSCYCGPVQKK